MRYNIGLNKKDDILKIDQKSFLRTVRHEFEEMLKKERIYKDKNTSFVQQNFINKITILFDEIKNNEKEKKILLIFGIELVQKEIIIIVKYYIY